jgi:hypothetical protein
MKKIYIAFVLLFTVTIFLSNSQETVSIGLTKMNVLYLGVDNPATIAVSGAAQKDLKVTTDNGSVKLVKNNFLINPIRLGKAVITVSVKEKLAGTLEFRVRKLPNPVAKVNGHSGGEVAKALILAAGGITAEFQESEFDYHYRVVSFSVTALFGNMELTRRSSNDKFTSEQLDLIKNVKVGDKFRIDEIMIIGPEGSPRDPLQPIVFKLK